MAKIEVSKLTGAALDFAVAKCLDGKVSITDERGEWLVVLHPTTRGATGGGNPFPPVFFNPSTNWSQGGPIIEREKISVIHMEGTQHWVARKFQPACDTMPKSEGPTSPIAAMRCYVASKLGDEVDVPEELT